MERWTSWLGFTCLATILLAISWPLASASKPRYHIYWNSSSKIFDLNNDADFTFRLKDIVELFCPTYPNFTQAQLDQIQPEVSVIHMVSYESYVDCRLHSDSVSVQRCDRPAQNNFRTFVIRSHSPMPYGLEFQPGGVYYFISTSDGTKEGIDRTDGGLCKERNMRMRVSIVGREDALIADPRLPRIEEPKGNANRPLDDLFDKQFSFAEHSETAQTAGANNFASTVDQTYVVEEFVNPEFNPIAQVNVQVGDNGGAKLQLSMLMSFLVVCQWLWMLNV